MKARFPLTWKILLVALVNVATLAVIALAFVQYELGQEFTSALLAPGRDRTLAIARQLALDLNDTAAADRDALLERYQREHGVAFLIMNNDGVRLAGSALNVPAEVIDRIVRRPREGPPPGAPEGRGRPPNGRRPPPDLGGPPPHDDRGVPPMPQTPPFLVTTSGADKYWTGVRIPIRARDREETVAGTVLIVSRTLVGNPMYFQPWPWLGIVAVTLGVTALCWIPFVRGVTRSVADMTRATADIAEGRFDAVPQPRRRDELGLLAASIGGMAARLQSLLLAQKRFLRDAAHELRSPLGRMSLSIGLLEREPGATSHTCARDLREEVELMTGLTHDLLVLAQSETTADQRRLSPTNVRDAAERAVRIEAASAEVRVEIDRELRARADPDLLFRAISNLVRNAVAYAGSDGPIDVRARRDGDAVRLSVSDRGPGVPDADVNRLFLPFYRPEASRDRRSGGAGLGLAIVRTAVEACGGSVTCRNLAPGFEVTMTLRASAAS
jgi:two-component system, OmpR family, sensor histidine kinase CpxA